MNQRITLPALAKALAADSGRTRKQCEDFLRELFTICIETLSAGEDIKVRGLGSFRIVVVEERKSVNVATGTEFRIPSHKKISFIPSPQLASAVNYAFEMFEPVELAENIDVTSLADSAEDTRDEADEDFLVSEDEYYSEDESAKPENDEGISFDAVESGVIESEVISPEIPDSVDTATQLEPLAVDSEPIVKSSGEVVSDSVALHDSEEAFESVSPSMTESAYNGGKEEEESSEEKTYDEKTRSGRRGGRCKFCWGVLTGFVGALLLGGVGFMIYCFTTGSHVFINDRKPVNDPILAGNKYEDSVQVIPTEETIVPQDTVLTVEEQSMEAVGDGEVATRPSDAEAAEIKVYDVISTTRFLTTMAREHYGNDAFWPYIYEENKSFLRHPDRIRPGTRVVVPPLSKYGVNPRNAADIKRAKQLGVEIYSRYKK